MSKRNFDEIVAKLNGAKLPDVDFEAYYKAHDEDTQKIKRTIDYYDEIEDFLENGDVIKGAKLPFSRLENLFRFREGEVTLWTGYNGHKKSMLLGFVAVNLLKQQEKVCTASFEMKPLSTIARMCKQYTAVKNPSYDEFGDFIQMTGNNFYILDHQGGLTPSRMLAVIYYAATECGVKHFIIDSLMRVISGEDSYNEQKDFVVKLCDMAIKTKIHIHLVHHTKKGKESEPSGRYDAKGSGAISDNVHNSLVVWSNKEKHPEMPDMILKCDKQREGEWEGKIALNFIADTLRFEEKYNVD